MSSAGIFEAAGRTRWRNSRLLILAYHGIAFDDEHEWDPSLYITPEQLESRLQTLRDADFTLLPLGDAIENLYAGTLPDRSVTLTFDDGYHDFAQLAWPLLKAHQAPATVYLTTYYCEDNRPVPGITASYMLWKQRARCVRIAAVPGFHETVNLSDARTRNAIVQTMLRVADENRFTADEKDAVLRKLADEVHFDMARFCARRKLHVMNPEEAKALAADGLDIQLHTHRHRTPKDESLFRREIEDNRRRIETLTGRPTAHFCYPSGVYFDDVPPWLQALNVTSATTCDLGIASQESAPLLLPRFLDHSRISREEFEAWISGVGHAIRRRVART